MVVDTNRGTGGVYATGVGHTTTNSQIEAAIDRLQELGVGEYDARWFVGLPRLSTGTAKWVSEVTDMPRTRVYEAIRLLETRGLVEVQHLSPQQFRAVPVAEAIETFRAQYEDCLDRPCDVLDDIDPVEFGDWDRVQRVWALSDPAAIATRTRYLVSEASDEVVLVLGSERTLTDDFVRYLNELDPGADVFVGGMTEAVRERIGAAIPAASTFVSDLEWPRSPDAGGTHSDRLLLVDDSRLRVSSVPTDAESTRAVCGSGPENGMVAVARRLLSHERPPGANPG